MSEIIRSLQQDLNEFGTDLHLIGGEKLNGRHPGEHPDNFGAGAMAQPATPEAAVAIVRWCIENNVPVVPQGGRTGLVGGGISRPGELILSTAKLDRIEAIDPLARTATVGAGVTLQALQEAAAEFGLTPGIDLAARGSATIGGMIATNAGGILAFRNGVMRHQVLGVEAVMPDGSLVSDLTRVLKVSAGPDIKQLLIGSEGAYGFVTRAVVKLESFNPIRATALVGVPDATSALALIGYFRAQPSLQLEGAELMWRNFFVDSARERSFEVDWLDEETPAVLLMEVSAASEENARSALEDGLAGLWEEHGLTSGIVAASLDQARRFWALREESDFIYRVQPGAPSFDVSVPPGALDAYVTGLKARLKAVDPGFDAYVYGHIADGNLHISVIGDGVAAADLKAAIEDAVYTSVAEAGGSFSAEHGVGTEKRRAYLTFGNSARRAVAQAIKAALDPKNLFNPGKVPYRAD
ncbi:FAD-binding oxidoreductase [Shinella curvata]|uniref:FAD-binding oxidoreductase n=1 Tax=Shinella curvata TaxID=1817964 RepID=A0ABT8XH67_9HYPH|nr:FAD-binding oxidoreductase [Shinella curvata]MCJ8053388.1 FAD-binding oxidoreductase [Shinella curvata]MDO6122719.1 FAD-binding oxidoreductase [Shinella curvata]